MKQEQTRYIVKRNYNNSRTVTEAFVKLIKKDNDIEYTQYNIDKNKKMCYDKHSFRESCVIPKNSKEE